MSTAILQGAAAFAAIIVAAGPQLKSVLALFKPKPLEETVAPSYRDAMTALASVRLRLRATDRLDEDRKKAFDSITLALVDGSDQ